MSDKKNVNKIKVGITLDKDLLTRIDNYADKNYVSRSGFLSMAATQLLNSFELNMAIKSLTLAMKKIADTGKIDDETLEKLQDFERLANFIMPKSDVE